jgi:hypothetical protein
LTRVLRWTTVNAEGADDAMVDDGTSRTGNGWLVLAAVLAVLAVIVIVLAFLGIGGDTNSV